MFALEKLKVTKDRGFQMNKEQQNSGGQPIKWHCDDPMQYIPTDTKLHIQWSVYSYS